MVGRDRTVFVALVAAGTAAGRFAATTPQPSVADDGGGKVARTRHLYLFTAEKE